MALIISKNLIYMDYLTTLAHISKGFTANGKIPIKIYFHLSISENDKVIIVFEKLILVSKDSGAEINLRNDIRHLKTFKDKVLFSQTFSLQFGFLKDGMKGIIEILNQIIESKT